jgi:hypothetical protein
MKTRLLILAGTLACGMAPLASAQSVLIRGAKVHTVTERGTLENADVLINDGRIVEVGRNLVAGPGTSVVEARGRPLTPGLFGGITGLGIQEVSLESSTVDNSPVSGDARKAGPPLPRPEFDVTPAFNPDSMVIGVNRVDGITSAMVAPGGSAGAGIIAGQGAVARLDGRVDAFVRGSRSLFVDLGSDAAGGSGRGRAAQFMLLDQAVREARPPKPMMERDYQLLTASGRETLATYLNGGRVVFDVNRAADIRQVLQLAARTGLKPVIVGGAQAPQVASLLASARVPVFIDPLENLPESFDQMNVSLENAARLNKAGVEVSFTNLNDGTHNARKVRQAAGVAVANGMPWDAALAALTANPARAFGLGTEYGRIAKGYVADLVLWSGDPLEVTTLAEQVWIDGRAQSMRSRQTELRDRYRPR